MSRAGVRAVYMLLGGVTALPAPPPECAPYAPPAATGAVLTVIGDLPELPPTGGILHLCEEIH